MKSSPRLLTTVLLALLLAVLSPALQAEEGLLDIHVTDLEGKPVKVQIGPAGIGPYELTRDDGGARIVLPPQTLPGEKITLKVLGDDWVIFSPWDARVQVPPFDEQADRVTLVVVGRRHQKALLQSGDVLQAITRRILTAIEELEQRLGEVTPTMRHSLLTEQADAVGLSPDDVDHALRAWSDAPISSADKLLAREYLELFPQGSVTITGSTLRDPVIVTNPRNSPITIEKARERFELRGRLDELGLGMQVDLSVGASPPSALEGITCSWSLAPANLLTHLGSMDGPCELAVVLPVLPPQGRGERIPVTFGVRLMRDGIVVDELTREATVANQILAEVLVDGERLGPATPITASIVDRRSQQLLSHYECLWNFHGHPIVWTPRSENRCRGTLTLKPEETWSAQERVLFWAGFSAGGGQASVGAHLRARGTEESLGMIHLQLRYEDLQEDGDPRNAMDRMTEAIRSQMTRTVLGGAPQRAHFQPNIEFKRGIWRLRFDSQLQLMFVEARGRFDDGEWFPVERFGAIEIPPGSRKVTFQVESDSASSGELFGYDLEEATRASLLKQAKSHPQLFSCSGEDFCEVREASLLWAIRSIAWGSEPEALESKAELPPPTEDFLKKTLAFSYQSIPRPLCGEALFYRLEFVDGTQSPVRSIQLSRRDSEEYVCSSTDSKFKDPRILVASDASALPVFGYYSDTGSRRGLMLRTFSAHAAEEVHYSYTVGGTRIQADDYYRRAFSLPGQEGATTLDLEFTLVGGAKVGPFTYAVDLEALRMLRQISRFSLPNSLNCFRMDPSLHSQFHPEVTEKSTICLPAGISGSQNSWAGVSRLELGTTPDRLEFSQEIRNDYQYSQRCLMRSTECLFSFLLPYDTEEVFYRVHFRQGGWSDIHRLAVR